MEAALDRHNRLLTEVIERHGGMVVTSRGEGDSFFAVFPGAVAAVEAAGRASCGPGSDCSVGADAVPAKVRAAVTGADVRLQLLGRLASRLHTDRRVWPDAGN